MLVATATALLLIFGLGGGESLEARFKLMDSAIKKSIDDKARRERARTIVEEMRSRADELALTIVEARREVIRADSRYRATRAEYRAAFAKLDAAWDEAERDLLALQLRLRAECTREEWKAIYSILDEETQEAD